MKPRSTRIVSLLICSIAVSGCDRGSSTGPPPQEPDLWPLAPGRSWVRQVSEYSEDGTLTASSLDSLWVTQTNTIGGRMWYSVAQSNATSAIPLFSPLGNLPGGIWMQSLSNSSADPEVVFRYPATAGTWYMFTGHAITVIADGGPLAVNDTTYGVWGYAWSSDGMGTHSVYFASEIGPVLETYEAPRIQGSGLYIARQALLVK